MKIQNFQTTQMKLSSIAGHSSHKRCLIQLAGFR